MPDDFRVKLTGGVGGELVFPYTPTITFGNTATYSDYDLVHTNYPINAFANSRPSNINITAPYYNQTTQEAATTARHILFLRSNMKMDFGANGTGAPPPVLTVSGYGNNLPSIKVVLVSFNTSFPPEPDYIYDGQGSYFPTDMTITIDLLPQYSASLQGGTSNNAGFDFNTFISGEGYAGGFI